MACVRRDFLDELEERGIGSWREVVALTVCWGDEILLLVLLLDRLASPLVL